MLPLRAVSAAAPAAPAADFVGFQQAGLGGIKEGREAAAVAELRRDTASLLIRPQGLAPRFVELVANGGRSQLLGVDGLSPALLYALQVEIELQFALLAMARQLAWRYDLSKGVGGSRLQAGLAANGLDNTFVQAVATKVVDVSGMPPLERVIGFPPIGAGALAIIVSCFMPSLDLSADAGLYAALKGNTLLAHGRFDPNVIAMTLSAKLGVIA